MTAADPSPPPTDDPLADLRTRIQATRDAAERLQDRAASAREADATGAVPPHGWATPEDRGARADEVHALAELVRVLRDLVPTELQGQVTEVLRQLLMLVRAIIDWWVDRLDPEDRDAPRATPAAARPAAPRMQDIPID